MQIQFQLSFNDYLAAQWLHDQRTRWTRFTHFLNRYLVPLLGAFSVLCGLLLVGSSASLGSVLMLTLWGALLICYPFYRRMRLKRCYKRTRSGSGECKLSFGEDRIGVEGENARGEMDWKAVKSFQENDKIFLLYTAPAIFIPVPKRICSVEQIDELRSILIKKIKPEASL